MSMRSFTFLGTGTSVGVPMIGCDCRVCTSDNPRNHRFRCAGLIKLPNGNILIDTPPELRLQLLRAKVGAIHSVLFTHYHADHLHGLDDLRPIQHFLGQPVPLFCAEDVEERIRSAFSYAFDSTKPGKIKTYVPNLSFERIKLTPVNVLGEIVTPVPLIHGNFDVLGFRIKDLAYCTDVNHIPENSMKLLQNLDILVLDALRDKPHPAHFNLKQALEIVEILKPKQTYFTHLCHDLDHDEVEAMLPKGVNLAYDGLTFEF
ncbi:MBL fold metallo-hydrolase [bacterium]|nr:MBL fold metallo-hydrolase [bacterium]